MKKTLFALFAALSLVLSTGAGAQNTKVSGNVKDSDGLPAIGAGVLIKGTTVGTVTDMDGNFTIDCEKGATLVISYIGCKDTEVVAGDAPLSVVLMPDNDVLDEVVVLGYGIQQKRQDLSASVGVVKDAEKLMMRSVNGSTGMLQGQIPGVTIQENGGDPTAELSMVVRGQGSPSGDSVLWIVDGVPGAAIPSVDEIESVVVLKDAASAAIYGAQSGAGGVVIVTTKHAKRTQGVQFEYNGQVGLARPTNLIHGLNAQEMIDMRHASCKNAGMSDFLAGYDQEFIDYISTTRTDWVSAITRTAVSHRHTGALSYGSDNIKSRLSLSYNDHEGTLLNTYSKTFNVNYKGDFDINDYIKITENLNWSTSNSRGTNTNSEMSGTLINAIYSPAFSKTWEDDGRYASWLPEKWSAESGLLGDCYNPLRQLLGDDKWNRGQTFETHTALQIHNILPGLKFTSRFSYWLSHDYHKNFHYYRYEITGRQEASSQTSSTLNEAAYYSTQWKTENTLSYDKTFGKHSVSAMVSTTADSATGRQMSIEGIGFDDESVALQYINFAKSFKANDSFNGKDTNLAVVARLAYSFDDRYFATASWRRDYAGRLPYANNHGDFPAFTAAWKMSSEKFFEPIKNTVNLLKIRGSFGRVGNINSIPWNYSSNNLVVKNETNDKATYGMPSVGTVFGTYIYNGKALNTALTWETCEQWGIGLDGAFLKNRLTFSADFYNKRTYNLIQDQTTDWPTYMGFDSAPKVNQGEVLNRGVELELGWSDKVGKDWNYYARGNFSYNHNEILSTGVRNADGSWAPWTGGGASRCLPYCYQSHVGGPLNEFYVIKCLGMFMSEEDIYEHNKDGVLIQPNAQPGDLKFEDYNGDGKIDDSDRQYMGSATPKITYSFSGGFSYKDFSLDLMFLGVAQAQVWYPGKAVIYSDTEGNFCRAEGIKYAYGYNGNTTNALYPRLSRNDPNGNFSKASSWFLEDGSYLRLKSVTLSYDFTNLIRKCAHLDMRGSRLTAYASGDNLFTITRYSGMDPECGGYDSLKYPVSRIITFGVKITY